MQFVKDRLFVNGVEVVVDETGKEEEQNIQTSSDPDKLGRGKRVIYKSKPQTEQHQQYRGHVHFRACARGYSRGVGRGTGNWFAQPKSLWGMSTDALVQNNDFVTPLRNRYAAISRYVYDEERPIQISRKHQASSPLDSALNLKNIRKDVK